MSTDRSFRLPRRVSLLILCAVIAVAAAVAAGIAIFRPNPRPDVPRPARLYPALAAARIERTLLPRTSVEVVYRACRPAGTDSTLAAECPAGERVSGPDDGGQLEAWAATKMVEQPDADAMHTAALVGLLARPGPPQLAGSIELMRSALAEASRPDSAAMMVDLGAAYMVLAGREQSADPLLHALDWTDRALELQPRSASARFNRALVLDALTAKALATAAWRQYLAGDSVSAWADEAKQYLASLLAPPETAKPMHDASASEVAAFAVKTPGVALTYGWEELLPEWGRAIIAGDTATAHQRLLRAEIIGEALVRRGGDASLADQVRIIRESAAQTAELRSLARLHATYGDARAAVGATRFARAEALFASIPVGDPVTPLERWALVSRAGPLLDMNESGAAEQQLERAAALPDWDRYPAIAARATWIRGTGITRLGRAGYAAPEYRQAEALFARMGDRMNRGAAQVLVYDAEHFTGNQATGDAWLMRAALTLRPFGQIGSRHMVMAGLAQSAWAQQLARAAEDLSNEDVLITRAMGSSAFTAEARIGRASLRADRGDTARAMREVEEIEPMLDSLDSSVREYVEATASYTRGLAQLRNDPQRAGDEFTKLLDRTGKAQEIWRGRGFAGRARARLEQRDIAGARADLDNVFMALERARGNYGGAAPREVEGDVRRAMLRLVGILAARGEQRLALEYLETGTAALSSAPVPDHDVPSSVMSGRVVVRPLLIGDTLLVWTARGNRVELTRTIVSAAELGAAIARANEFLRDSADVQAWKQLARLYDLLIRPIERQLRSNDEVVFVNDAELAAVPLTALRDSVGHDELLLDHHVVWRARSVAAAARRADVRVSGTQRATFVAPSFDPERNPGLEELPGAVAEVHQAARGYISTLIQRAQARPAAVEAALGTAPVLHFAGHAMSDNLRPERSYLVLAPEPGRLDGRLNASSIEKLNLSHLRLVVLSACSTLGGESRSSGFTGLSGAFLGAGAQGVVGSLWRVDDEATRELMVAFHQAYQQNADPARALAMAQRQMLRNRQQQLLSPSRWAAFQYVGR